MRKRRWLYGSVLSLFVFVGFSSFFSLGMLERAVSYIVYPLLVAQHKLVTPLKSYFQQRRTVTELGRLIAKVQADRDELISENISLHSLLSYALETEELVRYKKRYDLIVESAANIYIRRLLNTLEEKCLSPIEKTRLDRIDQKEKEILAIIDSGVPITDDLILKD